MKRLFPCFAFKSGVAFVLFVHARPENFSTTLQFLFFSFLLSLIISFSVSTDLCTNLAHSPNKSFAFSLCSPAFFYTQSLSISHSFVQLLFPFLFYQLLGPLCPIIQKKFNYFVSTDLHRRCISLTSFLKLALFGILFVNFIYNCV